MDCMHTIEPARLKPGAAIPLADTGATDAVTPRRLGERSRSSAARR